MATAVIAGPFLRWIASPQRGLAMTIVLEISRYQTWTFGSADVVRCKVWDGVFYKGYFYGGKLC
jgi:hypothetical protein